MSRLRLDLLVLPTDDPLVLLAHDRIILLGDEGAAAGDLDRITLCARALAGDADAVRACARIVADATALVVAATHTTEEKTPKTVVQMVTAAQWAAEHHVTGRRERFSVRGEVRCVVWMVPELGPARWDFEIWRGMTMVASGHVPEERDEESALSWVRELAKEAP